MKMRLKDLLARWRDRRRASSLPPGEGLQTTAPTPPGAPPPISDDTPPSSSPRDEGGRPQSRTQRKLPIGGPFTAI